LVSIVVTTSDFDERFLDACLHSVRASSYSELDVVVATWGSDQAVRRIVRRHAAEDVRVRWLPRASPDRVQARAAAVASAKGKYLQFVRGEDQLPSRGIAALVDSLLGSGSDLAVGRRRNVVTLGRRVREIRDPLDGWAAARLTMSSCPAVVSDLGLENRMFRTEFWARGQQLWIGRGITEAETVLRATMAARTFDLVDAVAYRDMNRAVGVPVGALADPLEDLSRWLGDQQGTLAAVTAVGAPDVIDYWVSSVLDGDLQDFLDHVEVASDSQWETLRDHAAALLDLAPAALGRIRAESRVKVWLLANECRDKLADLVAARWFESGNKPSVVEVGGVYADLPGFRDPQWGVPDEIYLMSPGESALEVVLRRARWTPHDSLEVTLFAWIDFVSYPGPAQFRIDAVDLESGERIELPLTTGRSPAINHLAEHRYQDYSWGLVEVSIPIRELAQDPTRERRWRLEVEVRSGPLTRVGGLTRRDEHGPARFASARLPAPRRVGGVRARLAADPEEVALLITTPAPVAQLVAGEVEGRRVTGRLELASGRPDLVRAEGPGGRSVTTPLVPTGDAWAFELMVPKGLRNHSDAAPGIWVLRVVTQDGHALPIGWPPEILEPWAQLGVGSLALASSALGNCELVEANDTLVIDAVAVHDATGPTIEISGRWLGERPRDATLTLTSPRTSLVLPELGQSPDGSVRWGTRLESDEWGRGPLPVPSGRYVLRLACASRTGRLRMAGRAASSVLNVTDGDTYSWRVFRAGSDVVVHLARPVGAEERSPYYQRQLQVACLSPDRPLRSDAVYLQSYVGASATDSQLAIHRELRRRWPDWTLIWGIHDRSSWVPEDAVAVVMNTREWYDALATSRYLVNNIDFDRWFSPRPGQKFLQTFHGYPAKSMGIRLWEAKSFTPRRIAAELARTSGDWDLILTPTPEMDEHYRREYRYTGEIHSAGYPRDDELVGPQAPEIRDRTRRLLNIEPGQTVVLYAPTWRDDMATNYRNAEMAEHIDLEDASELLGPEFVFLMRGHRFHGKAGTRGTASARLIDVTHYPEINDLILASDAAVLDYSSLRFDFALTRRPMLFLVPDLASYTGSVRGFLYDFASSAPGPLLDTPDQVVAALQDLPRVSREYAAAYETFHQTFNYLQDGRAAERVVSAFFDPDQP